MGHAVLTVERLDAVLPFYRDVLGFRLSDYILKPFRAFFLHVNPRHHSLAFIETGMNGMHHMMVELFSFDDVGQGYDIALGEPESIGVTLGRHTNDHVTSFYSRSPSGFMVEYGWGGRCVTPGNWTAEEYTVGPSLWGHERNWLPEEKRAEARAMRMKLATGRRAPSGAGDRGQLPPDARHLPVVGRGGGAAQGGLTARLARCALNACKAGPPRQLRLYDRPRAAPRPAYSPNRLAPSKTCWGIVNGRTADSDSVSLGSNPSSPANQDDPREPARFSPPRLK